MREQSKRIQIFGRNIDIGNQNVSFECKLVEWSSYDWKLFLNSTLSILKRKLLEGFFFNVSSF